MLDPAIADFLRERKELWLAKKINQNSSDEEKAAFEQQAAEEFSFSVWAPNAAKRAKQLSLVSHPSKFSHPSAKTTNIIANGKPRADGLLRSGNVMGDLDVLGNAAALDVYKFLSLKLADGQTILSHLGAETPTIKEQLDKSGLPYSEIAQDFLAIKQNEETIIRTSDKVKQVYFPVSTDDHYHLLSILTPSSMMYKLKERIQTLHFSEETKEARESKKESRLHAKGFSEVFGLSVVGYGGTKPQNISVLNSQNYGEAYLLPSVPPILSNRKIQPPRRSFFTDSLWLQKFKDDFRKFHDLLSGDANNMHIRRRRDWLIRSVIHQVVDRLWLVRSLDAGWSESDNYQALPQYQKIWLDQAYAERRHEDEAWFVAVQQELARWFERAYRKLFDAKAIPLGDTELPHIKKIIHECEGGLR